MCHAAPHRRQTKVLHRSNRWASLRESRTDASRRWVSVALGRPNILFQFTHRLARRPSASAPDRGTKGDVGPASRSDSPQGVGAPVGASAGDSFVGVGLRLSAMTLTVGVDEPLNTSVRAAASRALSLGTDGSASRGRDAGYPAPPAQIRTSGFPHTAPTPNVWRRSARSTPCQLVFDAGESVFAENRGSEEAICAKLKSSEPPYP